MIVIQPPKPYDWEREDWTFLDELIHAMSKPLFESAVESVTTCRTILQGG